MAKNLKRAIIYGYLSSLLERADDGLSEERVIQMWNKVAIDTDKPTIHYATYDDFEEYFKGYTAAELYDIFGYGCHTLDFSADYYFCVEEGRLLGYKALTDTPLNLDYIVDYVLYHDYSLGDSFISAVLAFLKDDDNLLELAIAHTTGEEPVVDDDPFWEPKTEPEPKTTRIGFINPTPDGLDCPPDETEFDTQDYTELAELWFEFCKDEGIITYVDKD